MREIRPSGSEGGAGRKPRSYLYLAGAAWAKLGFLPDAAGLFVGGAEGSVWGKAWSAASWRSIRWARTSA